MPVSLTTLFRSLIALGLAAHVFFMYGTARTMQETFGFVLTTATLAASFATFMLLPLLWAVILPDLPLILSRHRDARRFRAGRCPSCNYRVADSGSRACPECGRAFTEPPRYEITWATARRFLHLNLAALVLGAVLCETWLLFDERRFRDEVEQHAMTPPAAQPYARPRAFPFGKATLTYTPGFGFSATD